MRRVVFDVGVLVSALLSREGTPALALDSWRDGAFDLVVSPLLLDELERVLRRPKFRRYLTAAEVTAFVVALEREAIVVADPEQEHGLTEDPGDDYLVSLARAARADWLVSGDAHLLGHRLEPPVVAPREFLELLPG